MSRAVLPGHPRPSRWASAGAAGTASPPAELTVVRGRAADRRPTARRRRAAILRAEIERPRVGPMRDIVATIQPEQDDLVRAELDEPHLRAGRAGHRQDRGRPAPRGVPALHLAGAAARGRRAGGRAEPGVPALHRRGAAGAGRGRRRPRPPSTSCSRRCPVRGGGRRRRWPTLKGDARMAEVLRRALCAGGSAGRRTALVVIVGARRYRVRADGSAGTSTTCAAATSRTRPPANGCTCTWPRTCGGSGRRPAARRGRGERGWPGRQAVREFVDAVWPAVDPAGAAVRALHRPGRAGRRRPRPARPGGAGAADLGRRRRAAPRSGPLVGAPTRCCVDEIAGLVERPRVVRARGAGRGAGPVRRCSAAAWPGAARSAR